MSIRLPLGVIALVGLVVFAVAVASNLGGGGTASGATATPLLPYQLNKTADNPSVSAGGQIGFKIRFYYTGYVANQALYIQDAIPGAAGTNWTIDTADGADCTITGAVGSQVLNCTGYADSVGYAYIQVHVISPTTTDSCGDYPNTAFGGPPDAADAQGSADILVDCPTVTPAPNGPSGLLGGQYINGNVLLQVATNGETLRFDAYDVPPTDSCATAAGASVHTVDLADVPVTGESFSLDDGTNNVEGTFSKVGSFLVADGQFTAGEGTDCEIAYDFDAEEADRAYMQGDVDCSWEQLYGAGTEALPQGGAPPNPNTGITVQDVIDGLKYVGGLAYDKAVDICTTLADALPTPGPTLTPLPSTTPRPQYPQGDVDCSSQITPMDMQELLVYLANLGQPAQGPGCVQVGHFYLLDR